MTNRDEIPTRSRQVDTRRARSFGAEATAYADHRPDYPRTAVEWILAVGQRQPKHVLDLAAGTGKLTGVLLTMAQQLPGLRITAVEPDPAMRAELVSRYPEVTALDGTAEQIPLDDAAVDAVLVGQAFHWFDVPAALAEIARVLRSGGILGALWNTDHKQTEWLVELGNLMSIRATSTEAELTWEGEPDLAAHPEFVDIAQTTFDHTYRRTAESLIATIATFSPLLVLPEHERRITLGKGLDYLRGRPETASGEFDLPLQSLTIRARRR
jgi:SAM-dependent methyltransferase